STTADAAGGRGRATLVCGALARPADARGFPRWARVRVDPHGVRTARAVPAQSASGADAGADHGAGLELRLRADVESARGVHQLPAAEDGGGRGAAPDPYGARGRVRVAGARAVSLRTRLTLAGGGAVFVALAIASLVIYAEVRSKLHDQIDVSLIQSAEGVATKWAAAKGPLKLPSGEEGAEGEAPPRPVGKVGSPDRLERCPLVRQGFVRLLPGHPELACGQEWGAVGDRSTGEGGCRDTEFADARLQGRGE